MKKLTYFILITITAFFCYQCDKNNEIHVFSVEQDKELGRQTDSAIQADKAQFPILDEAQYPAAYAMIRNMTNKILNSGAVAYKEEFIWQVKIINDPKTLNAFCTPGGYIYVYTGLILYLDQEDDLAGVMGHEIAHADQRHSISTLEKQYGYSVLLSIILGDNPNKLAEIAAGLAGQLGFLKYSRTHEQEADEFSVKYLAPTDYKCNGAASFFEKLVNSGDSPGVPEFLSTHPDPGNRVTDINKTADELKCNKTSEINNTNYTNVKATLPQ